MVFVYNVEYYLNVSPVSEQSFSQVWSDLKVEKKVLKQQTTKEPLAVFNVIIIHYNPKGTRENSHLRYQQ